MNEVLQDRSWDWRWLSKPVVCVKLTWQRWHHCESSVHWTWSSGWVEPAQQTPPNQGPSGLHDGLTSWLSERYKKIFLGQTKTFHYKTSSTSISNTFHWLEFYYHYWWLLFWWLLILLYVQYHHIISQISKAVGTAVVALSPLLPSRPLLLPQVWGYFEWCSCWLIVLRHFGVFLIFHLLHLDQCGLDKYLKILTQ